MCESAVCSQHGATTQGIWKFFSASAQSLKPKMFFHSFIHFKISASARFSDTLLRRQPRQANEHCRLLTVPGLCSASSGRPQWVKHVRSRVKKPVLVSMYLQFFTLPLWQHHDGRVIGAREGGVGARCGPPAGNLRPGQHNTRRINPLLQRQHTEVDNNWSCQECRACVQWRTYWAKIYYIRVLIEAVPITKISPCSYFGTSET